MFLRHLECPCCELIVRGAVAVAPQYPEYAFVLISQASDAQNEAGLRALGITLPGNVQMVGDKERAVRGAFGVGEIGFFDVFRMETMKFAIDLREEGIKNGITIGTRYQATATDAVFAVDANGVVCYSHVGKHAGDVSDIKAACAALS